MRSAIRSAVPATAEEVYRAWTEPDALRGWLCEDASGRAEPGAKLILAWPSLGQRVTLDVLEARPGQLLRVAARIGTNRQLQEVRLAPGRDGCVVELSQDADDELATGIEHGWRLRLYLLEHYLRHRSRRATLTVAGSAIGDAAAIFAALVDAAQSCALAPPHAVFAPDAAGGELDDDIVYTLRRFTMATGSHLLAIQLMTWNETVDLERRRAIAEAVIRTAVSPMSQTLH